MSNRYLQFALCPDCGEPLVSDGRDVQCVNEWHCGYARNARDAPDTPTARERGAWADQQRCEGCE